MFSVGDRIHTFNFGIEHNIMLRITNCFSGYRAKVHVLFSSHRSGPAVCVLCFLPIHSGHQVRWTYQPGSHRRKVTQDF